MAKDISRKSVMILVTVALIVSILSTLFVLNAVYTYSPSAVAPVGNDEVIRSSGTVSFVVKEAVPSATVSLKVVEPREDT